MLSMDLNLLHRATRVESSATSPGVVTLKMLENLWSGVRSYLLSDGSERVAYAFGFQHGETVVLTHAVLPPDAAYKSRSCGNVTLAGEYVTREVYEVFGQGPWTVIMNIHSHPFSTDNVWYSTTDDRDDQERLAHEQDKLPLAKQAFGQSDVAVSSFSMVVDQSSFDARSLDRASGRFLPVARLVIVGERLEVLRPTSSASSLADAICRQEVGAQEACFGTYSRATLAGVRVAVAGTGGIGSVVAELLVRQGVKDITLIDSDRLEASNLTRFQSGRTRDVGRLKVEVLREQLMGFFDDVSISAVPDTIYSPEAIEALSRCDLIVGAVDNTAARAFLSRLSVRLASPLLDCGAQIIKGSSQDEVNPVWRVGIIVPGVTACGDCSRLALFDSRRAEEEFLDPLTTRLAKEKGYLSDAPHEQGAAVYALNLACVAAVGLEVQNLLTGYRPGAHYLSNVAEYDRRYTVQHPAIAGQDLSLQATVRVPMGHVHATRSASCPHCADRLVGSLNAFEMLYPACSGRSRERVLPDPQVYLAGAARFDRSDP